MPDCSENYVGDEAPISPVRRLFRRTSTNETPQYRINKLDQASYESAVSPLNIYSTLDSQELEKDSIPEGEVPLKLNELCKLCGTHKLIPDSLKLKVDNTDHLEATEYVDPTRIFRSTFKGRKVAVKVVRLYVPQKLDEPLAVSAEIPRFAHHDSTQ